MLRQVSLLSTLFIFFVVVNVISAQHLNKLVLRDKKIHVILDELDFYAATDTEEDDITASGSGTIKKDARVAYLKSFLRKYDSELYDHAEAIVASADKHSIDYRLVPAIAMQESNLCRVIPNGSHNCWGWGIYGDRVTRFASYPEAIETVSAGLKKYYYDQGLTTPDQIMQKYTPSSNGSWARGVNFFFQRIE